MTIRVLVIEDGSEYTDTLGRFLGDGFSWARAGSGPEGLARLAESAWDAVFLDMRFDRVPDAALREPQRRPVAAQRRALQLQALQARA